MGDRALWALTPNERFRAAWSSTCSLSCFPFSFLGFPFCCSVLLGIVDEPFSAYNYVFGFYFLQGLNSVWLFSPPWDIFSLAMSNCYIFDGEIIMHVKKNTAIVVLLHARIFMFVSFKRVCCGYYCFQVYRCWLYVKIRYSKFLVWKRIMFRWKKCMNICNVIIFVGWAEDVIRISLLMGFRKLYLKKMIYQDGFVDQVGVRKWRLITASRDCQTYPTGTLL